jgi:hypothetical protein
MSANCWSNDLLTEGFGSTISPGLAFAVLSDLGATADVNRNVPVVSVFVGVFLP